MSKSIFIIASVVILLVGAAFGYSQEVQSEQDKKIDELLGKLGTRYWEKAADELVEIGIAAVNPLIETVNIGEGRPSENAVLVLAKIGTPKALDTVVGALKNQKFSGRVRAYAAMALGDLGSEDFVGVLIDALQSDKAWWVRNFAVGSLGKIGSERGIDPLIEAVNDENLYVRRAAVSVLGDLKPEKAVLPLVGAMRDDDWQVRLQVPDILIRFGSGVEEHFLEALKDENKWTKMGAINVLGRLKSDDAVLPLISLLEDQEQMVRDEAAVGLSRINSRTALDPLFDLLEHERSYVREEAAWVLGEMKSKDAVPRLIKALDDEEAGWMAAVALGKIGDEKAIAPLRKRAEDQDTRVGQAAAWALARMLSD
jgi:HEAT repeat protein